MSSNPTPDNASRNTIINNALTAAAAALGGPATSNGLQAAYQQTAGSLNQLTSLFNLTVDGTLASQHTEVVRANVNALFKEVLANPSLYGIANTSGSACTPAASSLTCSTAAIPGISYLFADDRHPTPTTHTLLGNYFASLLSAPYFAEALANTATAARSHIGDVLDARYHTLAHEQRNSGSVGAYTSISSGSQDATGNGTHKGQLATIGMDYQVSPALSMGMAFSQGTLDTPLGQAGKYDASHTQLSLTGQYRQAGWWLNADATLGIADIDTQRHINLGTAQRTEQGNTRSVYQQLRLNAGYQWQLGQWQTGPQAGISLMGGHIGAFTESGGSSTSMRYGKQKLDSQIVHAGWHASGKAGLFSPYFGIRAEQELKDDAPILRIGLTSTSGDFSVSGTKPDSRWLAWQAGTSITLGKGINGFLQATGTTGRSDANATRYQAGVAATF